MVEEGIGCALSIDGLVNTAERNLTFRPFEPEMKADLVFAWKKYQVFSKAAELFLNYLQKMLWYKKDGTRKPNSIFLFDLPVYDVFT